MTKGRGRPTEIDGEIHAKMKKAAIDLELGRDGQRQVYERAAREWLKRQGLLCLFLLAIVGTWGVANSIGGTVIQLPAILVAPDGTTVGEIAINGSIVIYAPTPTSTPAPTPAPTPVLSTTGVLLAVSEQVWIDCHWSATHGDSYWGAGNCGALGNRSYNWVQSNIQNGPGTSEEQWASFFGGGYDGYMALVTSLPPPTNGSFSFVATGDTLAPRSNESLILGRMASSGASFAILLGDAAIEPLAGTEEFANGTYNWQYFEDESKALRDAMPLYLAQGNHDEGWPSGIFANNATLYSFDQGPAHILLISTANAQWIDQLPAITADLANTTKRWKIVAMHKPRYTSGSHREEWDLIEIRNNLTPLFMQYNVSLTLSAHSIHYERTDMNGTIGITTTGTSLVQNWTDADYYNRTGSVIPPLWVQYRTYQRQPNFVKVTVNETALLVEGVNINGAVFDRTIIN